MPPSVTDRRISPRARRLFERALVRAAAGDAPALARVLAVMPEIAQRPDLAGHGPSLALAAVRSQGEGAACLRTLQAHGADLDALSHGVTPLGTALREGRASRVHTLLELGADPNAPTHSSLPVMLTIEHGSPEHLAALLAAGGDPNVSVGGACALGLAMRLGRLDMLGQLLAGGADHAYAAFLDPAFAPDRFATPERPARARSVAAMG